MDTFEVTEAEYRAREKAAHEAATEKHLAKTQPSFIDRVTDSLAVGISPSAQPNDFTKWVSKLPRNVTTGLLDAAINAGSQAERIDDAADKGGVAGKLSPTNVLPAVAIGNDVFKKVKPSLLEFRNYIAGQSRPGDEIVQAVSQYAIPFTGYAKALGGLQGASALGTVGRAALAETATASTVLAPHDPRMADIVALGKHTEGKFAEAMNTIAPDGSLFDKYIEYMVDREHESDAEGTFKNVVDNLGVSAAIAGFIKATALTMKGGQVVLRTVGENAAGRGSAFGPSKQKGMVNLFENNASGESAASVEAIRRAAQEKAAGQIRAVIDTDGTVRPLTGVDAVDAKARAGQVIVQRGIGVAEWTPLDRGEGVGNVTGRINAAREQLDKLEK